MKQEKEYSSASSVSKITEKGEGSKYIFLGKEIIDYGKVYHVNKL